MDNNYNKYLKYKKKYLQIKAMQNVQQGGSDDDFFNEVKINENFPSIYLFKANWCGHCKNFRETWNALANKYSSKMNFILYDSDKNKKSLKEWRVNSFPTIILRKGTKATEHNGDRDINTMIPVIENFIN
jgi:thiol-disulfide isomerase/thioredoxin